MVEFEKLQQDTMLKSMLCIDNMLKYGPVISVSSMYGIQMFTKVRLRFLKNDLYNYKFQGICYKCVDTQVLANFEKLSDLLFLNATLLK